MIMRRNRIVALSVMMLVLLTACGGNKDDEKINMPFGANDYKDTNYQDIVSQLEQAGFTNIEVVALDDLVTGWLTEDGEVEEVQADGRTTFSEDTRLAPDVKIVVTYHTFPEDVTEEETLENELSETVDSETEGVENTLTVDNDEDFAALLSSKEDHQLFKKFADNHKGETIEFDAHIDDVQNHNDYDTRYDILFSAGDWIDENTAGPGPIFKFEDENTTSMGIHDLYLPSFVTTGQNVRIVAEIKEYNAEHGIFYLEPVSLSER